MSNDYATDALISEIDAALNREPEGLATCKGHAGLAADVRLLLRCQRAQLQAVQRAATMAGGISAVVSAVIAGASILYQRLSTTP